MKPSKLISKVGLTLAVAGLVATFAGRAHAQSLAADGGHAGGNGGAGVVIDGSGLIATIGSLAPLSIQPLKMAEIPGLSELQDSLDKLFVPEEIRADLQTASLPTVERRYFKVADGAITPEKRQEIVDAYHVVLAEHGIPQSEWDVRVVALTQGANTLLLPQFFDSMKDQVSQSSILFHESLWVRFPPQGPNPSLAEYRRIINTDIAFEHWVRHTERLGIYHELNLVYGKPMLEIRGYAIVDQENGVFKDVISSDGTVPFDFFLGAGVVWAPCQPGADYTCTGSFSLDRAALNAHLVQQLRKFPESYLFLFLSKNRSYLKLSASLEGSLAYYYDLERKCVNALGDLYGFKAGVSIMPPQEGMAWLTPVPAGGPTCAGGFYFTSQASLLTLPQ